MVRPTHYDPRGIVGLIGGPGSGGVTGSSSTSNPGTTGSPAGTTWKAPVVAASTANGTLATDFEAGDTLDGVTLAEDDRILLKDQTAGAENGIYTVNASGAPFRAMDMNDDSEVVGSTVYVIGGTVNGASTWVNTNTTQPVLETDALTFAEFTSGSVPAGTYVLADQGGQEVVTLHGTLGATETIDLATEGNSHAGTLDQNVTFTFSGATSGTEVSFTLELLEDGTGGWTPTWPGSVIWPGGSAPTHDTTAGTTTLYVFRTRDATNWYGFQPGGGGSVTEAAVRDAGRWEVVVSGSAPPVAVSTPDDDDWVYAWVTG